MLNFIKVIMKIQRLGAIIGWGNWDIFQSIS